jgi:hypothetical protein
LIRRRIYECDPSFEVGRENTIANTLERGREPRFAIAERLFSPAQAEHRTDVGDQFFAVNRLDQIGVGAAFQPTDAIAGLEICG